MGLANLRFITIQTFYLTCANLELYTALTALKKINNFLTKKKRATASTVQKIAAHT
jgi:hypothetical protein